MSQLSGQVTVTAAGTAEPGPDIKGKLFAIQAHPSNSDVAWVGNDGNGELQSTNGFPLNAAGPSVIVQVDDSLNELLFDAATNGDKVCWLRLTK